MAEPHPALRKDRPTCEAQQAAFIVYFSGIGALKPGRTSRPLLPRKGSKLETNSEDSQKQVDSLCAQQ